MSIQVQQLLKIYGEQKAVNDISFDVKKGEIVGFLGPNGAGKSTTMKIITGYLQPDGGKATVCGIDVGQDPMGVKKKIGYLPELNALYYDMYVREYLRFIADIHQVRNPARKVEEVIALVGLGSESAKRIGQLSKGYKQRVGLAAALVHDPEVLILDEPTSGLDPNQIIEIREVIRKQGENKTVLFSSHILQEVEAICHRVVIINKGKMVANDSLQNLRRHSDGHILKLSFQEKIDRSLLENLPATDSATLLPTNEWQLATKDPDALRKQILELALQHNLNIVSLQSENLSLEEVFRTLTNSR